VGITRRLDREGVPTVTDSTASARDRYHEKEEAAVRRLRTTGGRAFSRFAAGSAVLTDSPNLVEGRFCELRPKEVA
jgi:hypothetical protein